MWNKGTSKPGGSPGVPPAATAASAAAGWSFSGQPTWRGAPPAKREALASPPLLSLEVAPGSTRPGSSSSSGGWEAVLAQIPVLPDPAEPIGQPPLQEDELGHLIPAHRPPSSVPAEGTDCRDSSNCWAGPEALAAAAAAVAETPTAQQRAGGSSSEEAAWAPEYEPPAAAAEEVGSWELPAAGGGHTGAAAVVEVLSCGLPTEPNRDAAAAPLAPAAAAAAAAVAAAPRSEDDAHQDLAPSNLPPVMQDAAATSAQDSDPATQAHPDTPMWSEGELPQEMQVSTSPSPSSPHGSATPGDGSMLHGSVANGAGMSFNGQALGTQAGHPPIPHEAAEAGLCPGDAAAPAPTQELSASAPEPAQGLAAATQLSAAIQEPPAPHLPLPLSEAGSRPPAGQASSRRSITLGGQSAKGSSPPPRRARLSFKHAAGAAGGVVTVADASGGLSTGGGSAAGGSTSSNRGEAEEAGEGGDAVLAELEAQRAKHAEQLRLEASARRELEEMMVRIERHFKGEQAGRRRAEELLAEACAERDTLRAVLAAQQAQHDQHAQQVAEEWALAEQAQVAGEVERTRLELEARLEGLSGELASWRSWAEASAGAAEAARSEVQRHLHDLDGARARMGQLAERLVAGGGGGTSPSGGGGVRHAGHRRRAGPVAPLQHGGPSAAQQLPRLRTRAVPGAVLLQPDAAAAAGAAATGGGGLPCLSPPRRGGGAGGAGASPAAVRRQYSMGAGPPRAPPDRASESIRDAAMVGHQARRWQGGSGK